MSWDAASHDEKRDQPIPTPLQPIAGTHSRTCSCQALGVNAIPNIELTMKVRPIGLDPPGDCANYKCMLDPEGSCTDSATP